MGRHVSHEAAPPPNTVVVNMLTNLCSAIAELDHVKKLILPQYAQKIENALIIDSNVILLELDASHVVHVGVL